MAVIMGQEVPFGEFIAAKRRLKKISSREQLTALMQNEARELVGYAENKFDTRIISTGIIERLEIGVTQPYDLSIGVVLLLERVLDISHDEFLKEAGLVRDDRA
jgi:hypothetical protein